MVKIEHRRLIIAFAVAPLASPLLLALASIVLGSAIGIGTGDMTVVKASLIWSWVWVVFGLPVSYGITLLAGLPTYLAFRGIHRPTLNYWRTIAAVLGALAGLAIGGFLFVPDGYYGTAAIIAVLGAGFGVVNARVFWHVAVRTAQPVAPPVA